MTPEALDRLHQLVSHVRDYTVQEDAAASEVMDAIISVVFDARSDLNLSKVPPRGRWGTQTAKAFRDALASAFEEAIAARKAS